MVSKRSKRRSKINVRVSVHTEKVGEIKFEAILHRRPNQSTLHIKTQEDETIPCPRYEIELVGDYSKLNMEEIQVLHSPKSKTEFIRWAARIKNRDLAKSILKFWCIGYLFAVQKKGDFKKTFIEVQKMKDIKKIIATIEGFFDEVAKTFGFAGIELKEGFFTTT